MANIPKFGRDSSKGIVWIKLIVSWAMSTNCCDALTAKVPVKSGGGKSIVELERTHSKVNTTKAQTAWQGHLNGANYPPLLDAILAAGSPSEAWTVILAWCSPNDEAAKYRTMREFEVSAMSDKELVPYCHENGGNRSSQDGPWNKPSHSSLPFDEVRDKLVLMMRDSLTRVGLERMVLESYHEMERKKGGK